MYQLLALVHAWAPPPRQNILKNIALKDIDLDILKIIHTKKSVSPAVRRLEESGVVGLAALNRYQPLKRADPSMSDFILDCATAGISVDFEREDDDALKPMDFTVFIKECEILGFDVDVCPEDADVYV